MNRRHFSSVHCRSLSLGSLYSNARQLSLASCTRVNSVKADRHRLPSLYTAPLLHICPTNCASSLTCHCEVASGQRHLIVLTFVRQVSPPLRSVICLCRPQGLEQSPDDVTSAPSLLVFRRKLKNTCSGDHIQTLCHIGS